MKMYDFYGVYFLNVFDSLVSRLNVSIHSFTGVKFDHLCVSILKVRTHVLDPDFLS